MFVRDVCDDTTNRTLTYMCSQAALNQNVAQREWTHPGQLAMWMVVSDITTTR